jgi:copper(I)-binding protein
VTRWNRRLLLGAIALLVPMLAGCEAGLDAPTLAFHPANNGANIVHNGITITNAFVLGPAPGGELLPGHQAGAFFSIQAENGDRLISVSAPDAASSVRLIGGSVNLPARTLVDLSGPRPRAVLTGLVNPLTGGQTVQLVFTFAVAGAIPLSVPVQPAAYQYATYSPPVLSAAAPRARASASPSATP